MISMPVCLRVSGLIDFRFNWKRTNSSASYSESMYGAINFANTIYRRLLSALIKFSNNIINSRNK
jgi:hypothetical protein